MSGWAANLAPAVGAAFSASLVEAVEALTIVLAVAAECGPRPATLGAASGAVCLALAGLIFGPVLHHLPIQALQLSIGILLLLFGTRWLRKAILRMAGVLPLRNETAAFAAERASLQELRHRDWRRLRWLGAAASFKAVLIEGIEVVFIVVALGTSPRLLAAASSGALAACGLVVLVGLAVRQPLARVPENTLKFAAGIMLSAFGIFWAGEGMGIEWPGADLAVGGFALCFLAAGLFTASILSRRSAQASAR